MISARSWSFWSCPGVFDLVLVLTISVGQSPRLRTRSRATCPKLPHVIAYFHTIRSRSRRLFLSKIVLVDCLSSTSSQNTKKLGGWGIECNWAWWGARGGKTSHTHVIIIIYRYTCNCMYAWGAKAVPHGGWHGHLRKLINCVQVTAVPQLR